MVKWMGERESRMAGNIENMEAGAKASNTMHASGTNVAEALSRVKPC